MAAFTPKERAAAVEKANQAALETAELVKKAETVAKQFVSEKDAGARGKLLRELSSLSSQARKIEAKTNELEDKKRKRSGVPNPKVQPASLKGDKIYARVSRKSFGNGSMKPERTLATAPEGERLGILTHPSWLVSHSDAMDNHAILRGRWIRERLLGGGIPDVPITVDAQLPDEPGTTLRHRMRVTQEKYCWTCHEKMDPLGMPFEMYNHAGLFRTHELDKPVDTSGEIIDSGDPALDGPVTNAIDMIQKLADSERVGQVFVRHAFRFWMGRNETLNDAPALQAAHNAYKSSGGSMNALITSLVTSDAFLYRTVGDTDGPKMNVVKGEPIRNWTFHQDGLDFEVKARLIGINSEVVRLQREEDSKSALLEIAILSDADRSYLESKKQH